MFLYIYLMAMFAVVIMMLYGVAVTFVSLAQHGYDKDNNGKNLFFKSVALGYLVTIFYLFLKII